MVILTIRTTELILASSNHFLFVTITLETTTTEYKRILISSGRGNCCYHSLVWVSKKILLIIQSNLASLSTLKVPLKSQLTPAASFSVSLLTALFLPFETQRSEPAEVAAAPSQPGSKLNQATLCSNSYSAPEADGPVTPLCSTRVGPLGHQTSENNRSC